MKDEELAEEIANKKLCATIMCYNHCDFNSPKPHKCGDWHRCYECALAGLKAGRPQWHDLQKDPNDLPENKRKVWCNYDDGYGKGFYDKDEGGWWIEGHLFCSVIIAWCELPTFDKE